MTLYYGKFISRNRELHIIEGMMMNGTATQKMIHFLKSWTTIVFLFCFAANAYGATIDVMIVYDSTAKAWVNSNGGMNVFAEDAVARMNQAAVNSNVDLTFRLVHAAEISYTYSGDLTTDLIRVQGTGDGYMDNVHTWRNTYGADIVVLLEDTGSAYGWVGIGYQLYTPVGDPSTAFTTCAIRSVDISHTMTHEVGHNLGCGHVKTTSEPNPGLYSYSAGWYFQGTNSTWYHTIMAYNVDDDGNYYQEAPLFSTPFVQFIGTIAGDRDNGDNSRTIRNTMNAVASYRGTVSDSTPDPFYLADQTGVSLSTFVISNTITVSGINTAAPVSITGGTYSLNSQPYTSDSGMANDGDIITVRLTSASTPSTTTSATLTIGGVSDTFSVTTKSAATLGTITVIPYPAYLNAQWTLTGPNGYSLTYSDANGSDATVGYLDPGNYTVTWGGVSGWGTPAAQTKTLAAGGSVTFTGTYLRAPDIPSPPTSGFAGSTITINGAYFGVNQGSGYVDFNGLHGIIVSWSDTQIVVIVPFGATSGCMTVVTDYGASSCIGFTVAVCSNPPVLVSGNYYDTVGAGYSIAASGNTLQVRATELTENVTLNRDIVVTLQGGYDCGYTNNPDYSIINGAVTITNGTVTVEKLIIK